MKIVDAKPPNYDEIVTAFPQAALGPTIYCWGDTIYAPGVLRIPDQLIAHEVVHSKQQKIEGPEQWWRDYIFSPQFRLEEEVPAHRAEYQFVAKMGNRHERRAYLLTCANRLSGKLYGNMVSLAEAKRLISEEA